jgi:hypothetical protein
MPAERETVEQVRRIDVDQYKYGFETLIESEKANPARRDNARSEFYSIAIYAARTVGRGGGGARRQRLCQGRIAAIADGTRGQGAEADLDLTGRLGQRSADGFLRNIVL